MTSRHTTLPDYLREPLAVDNAVEHMYMLQSTCTAHKALTGDNTNKLGATDGNVQ